MLVIKKWFLDQIELAEELKSCATVLVLKEGLDLVEKNIKEENERVLNGSCSDYDAYTDPNF